MRVGAAWEALVLLQSLGVIPSFRTLRELPSLLVFLPFFLVEDAADFGKPELPDPARGSHLSLLPLQWSVWMFLFFLFLFILLLSPFLSSVSVTLFCCLLCATCFPMLLLPWKRHRNGLCLLHVLGGPFFHPWDALLFVWTNGIIDYFVDKGLWRDIPFILFFSVGPHLTLSI